MDKYLIELLKEESTVIIPDFGALMASGTNNKDVMFNAFLKFDDGVLAKFVAEKENADLAETKNKIAAHVRDIKAQLDKGEKYSIFGLGTFSKNNEGEITFEQSDQKGTESSPKEDSKASTPPPSKTEEKAPEAKKDEPKKDEKPTEATKSSIKPKDGKASVSDAQKKNKFNEDKEEKKDPLAHVTPEKTSSKDKESTDQKTSSTSKKSTKPKKETKSSKKTKSDKKKPTKPSKKKEKTGKKGNGKLILIIILIIVLGGGGTFVGLKWDWVSQQLGIAQNDEEDKKEDKKKKIKKDKEEVEPEVATQDTVATSTDTTSMNDSIPATENSETADTEENNTPKEVSNDNSSQEPEESKQPQQVNSGSTSGSYYVIVNSFSVLDNANAQVSKLKSDGYSATIAAQVGGLHLVSAGAFSSKAEAQKNLSKIRGSLEPNAWVYSK